MTLLEAIRVAQARAELDVEDRTESDQALVVLYEEARLLRAEVADLRERITTGGPPAPFTPGWERGPSSRPPTAPPALDEVDLLAVDYTDEPPPR